VDDEQMDCLRAHDDRKLGDQQQARLDAAGA